jgi:DNA-binding MarR family transcriptional regulator
MRLFTSPPQLSDVAKMMNTSHQNVKVIAEKLEKKGHLIFVSDESDQRKVRVKLTQQSVDFWQSLTPKSEEAMNQIFEGIKPEDLSLFCDTLTQLLDNLDRMKENGK